jgi:hypothetical protein
MAHLIKSRGWGSRQYFKINMMDIYQIYISSHIPEWTIFSSLGPRIVVSLGPRAKKLLLALFFKTNTKFPLYLTILIQK